MVKNFSRGRAHADLVFTNACLMSCYLFWFKTSVTELSKCTELMPASGPQQAISQSMSWESIFFGRDLGRRASRAKRGERGGGAFKKYAVVCRDEYPNQCLGNNSSS